MKILVSLVSGQTMPNYFGIKYYEPEKCIFLYTEESKQQMSWLKNSIKISSETIKIDTYDYNDIQTKCIEIINKLNDDELILNYTCGTKIMSIAAFEIFAIHRKKTFYIDSENQRILEQDAGENIKHKRSLRFSVKDYLKIYGQEIKSVSRFNPALQELSDFIFSGFMRLSKVLLDLPDRLIITKQKISYADNKISICGQKGIVNLEIMNKTFIINSSFKEVAQFLMGGWLEYVTFKKLKDANIFDDLEINLKLDWNNINTKNDDNFKNEIDVFCTLNGAAYLFECKSGSINQDVIYKYKAFKEFLGGIYAKVIFINFFPVSDEAKEKIKDFNFKLINIKYIDEFIREIKEKNKTNPNL